MKHLTMIAFGLVASCTSNDLADEPDRAPDLVLDAVGPYTATTTVDVSAVTILPQADTVASTLRSFAANPARSLVEAADAAGVPAVAGLYAALPDALKTQLEGWIAEELGRILVGGKSLPEYAEDVAALLETALTRVGITSTLTMSPDGATHTLDRLDFSPAGIEIEVPLSGFGDTLTQTPSIRPDQAGLFSLADQSFSLAYGEYAWLGVNHASTQVLGADVRTLLGNVVDCPTLANAVASKCVLALCVGHETELDAICRGGLDALVDSVHARFATYRFDELRLRDGAGRLVDEDSDGIADRIENGTWGVEIVTGGVSHRASARWTASR
jgi:hypothetical protein